MAAKAGNVTVKKDNDAAKGMEAPLAGSYSPTAGLRGEWDRVFNRFLPEGWPYMEGLMNFEPLRNLSAGRFPDVMGSAKTDISETDSEYEVSVELPGIDEKDIDLDVSEGMLTLRANKREEREEKKKNYHLTERSYGSVRRSFRVPEGIDVGKIKANFAKGVLHVKLPKTKEAKAKQRKIPVKSS